MTEEGRTVRIKVSPAVARVVTPGASRELQLSAARGEVPLSGTELLTALLFLAHGRDPEIRDAALATLRQRPVEELLAVARDPGTHPQLLDFLARQRAQDGALLEALLENPGLPRQSLLKIARSAPGEVVRRLTDAPERLAGDEDLVAALRANPAGGDEVAVRSASAPAAGLSAPGHAESAGEGDGEGEDGEAEVPEEFEEDLNQSKYQQALELGVSEKIKIAMTGDKEWRSIFLKDANKLVSAAALKNPRITDGEVLAVAKNKSSSDELIRLITLNREWVKNLEIKKALVMHPKTPLPKALRYMNYFSEKDLKHLAKSRNVSQVLANNARRLLMAKEKK